MHADNEFPWLAPAFPLLFSIGVELRSSAVAFHMDFAARGQKKRHDLSIMPLPPSCHRALRPLLLDVDTLAQFLPRLEVRHVLRRHLDLLARFRVAAGARRPVVQS